MRKFINELIRTAKQEIKSYLPEEKECGAGMMYSVYEIFGTNQQMRKVIEQACERLMETYGLRHVELDILYLISHEKQKDTAKDLIEIQHLSKAHISKSVDNLKQHGYIELVADEADHRKIHIRMTGKAKPVLEEFEQIRADILERLFAGVTEEERSCLKRVMGKIMKNIQAEQEDGT